MVVVDAQLGEHYNFFWLRWAILGVPPPYILVGCSCDTQLELKARASKLEISTLVFYCFFLFFVKNAKQAID